MSAPTLELARVVVETAPGALGRDALVAHVHKALLAVYTDGLTDGATCAREDLLREQLAIARGFEQDSRIRVQILERELREHTERSGKKPT